MSDSILKWQLERARDARMSYYRHVYKDSLRLVSGTCPNKRVVIYCEQGIGDTIQLLRYVPLIKAKEITLHCATSLHRLIKSQWDVNVLDKENECLPDHEFHILSMDLPFIFKTCSNKPYIQINEKYDEICSMTDPVGIAWEGNPGHLQNDLRCCPLSRFKDMPGTLICLQNEIHREDLWCDDVNLFSVQLNDFYDTAKLINSVKYVVSVDTSILHLAGAMGKKTYGLLASICDPRWGKESSETLWYPSITLLRQIDGVWPNVSQLSL